MEDVMNRFSRISLACLVAWMASTAFSQDTTSPRSQGYFSGYESNMKARVDKIERIYLDALCDKNDGVVESALAHITRLKLYRPCSTCQELHQKLHSLAVMGRTPAIRFRAYLADLVVDSPELFTGEQRAEYRDPEEMFAALSVRLQTSLLGLSDRKYVRPE
jgi:hypothetical protein